MYLIWVVMLPDVWEITILEFSRLEHDDDGIENP